MRSRCIFSESVDSVHETDLNDLFTNGTDLFLQFNSMAHLIQLQRLTAHQRRLSVNDNFNLTWLFTQNYCMTTEDLKYTTESGGHILFFISLHLSFL